MSVLARAGILVALVAALSAPAAAQSLPAAPSPSPSPVSEIGRVVTSDRRDEPIEHTTRPTFVVDRTTIEAFGSRTLADALKNVPGVSLYSYGAYGAQTDYGLRGSSSAQTLVLRDGIPIAAATTETTDFGSLSTLGLARIEIVESASSTLYGTSATGGVINLISAGGGGAYARVSSGTLSERDAAAGASLGGLTAAFERHLASNVYDYPAFGIGPQAIAAGTRTNADAEQSIARIAYRAPLGAGWNVRAAAGDDAIHIGVPGSLVFGTTPLARQETSRTDTSLEFARSREHSLLALTLATVGQRLMYVDTGSAPDAGVTLDSRVQASLRFAATVAGTDVVAGVDFARERAGLSFGSSSVPVGAAQSQSAAYVQIAHAFGDLRATAGVRAENDAPLGGVIAPAFGLAFRSGGLRFTANASESFRVPTLIDLYYPGYSNPKLVPERLANFDASLAARAGALDATIGVFGRDGSNLITLDPTTFLPYNVARSSVNGAQFVASTQPVRHVRASFSVTDVYRALDTVAGTRLPRTSPITATLGFERSFDGGPLAFGARVRIVGAPDGEGPSGNPYTGYTNADAYVRYRLAPAAIVGLRVRNLGNERAMPLYGYPAPGRTYEVELATR